MATRDFFGDPPAGLDLSEDRAMSIYGSIIPVAVIATIVVGLRVRLRTLNGKPSFKIDDFMITLALVFTWGTAACCFISVKYGLGKHIWATEIPKLVTLWQILYAYLMIYATSVSLTNISILLFYRRIFRFELSFYAVGFIICVYWAIILIVINVGCRPLSYLWNRFGDPTAEGSCINMQAFFLSNGAWALTVDTLLVLIPIPTVMGLQMPLSERLAVVAILMLGGFVCITAVIRIISLKQFVTAQDLTWAMTPVFLWSSVEPFVGIICACLPAFGPYYRKWWTKVHSTLSGGKSQGYTNGIAGQTDGYANSKTKDTVRTHRGRRIWESLNGIDGGNLTYNGRLRADDEVELTTEVVGGHGHGQDESMRTISEENSDTAPNRGIQVKEEFTWTSEPVDVSKSRPSL